jgi:endo-1,4-beta-mannosidase
MNQIRASLSLALTVTGLVFSGVPVSASRDTGGWWTRTDPVLYSEAVPVAYAAKMPAFVTRSGATLLVDGRPYRFTGLNIYNANNRGECWYELGTTTSLDRTLSTIGPTQNVFRAWFFQSLATRTGQRDWSAFDATLAVARAHDERVIATLGNQLGDCEGPAPIHKTEGWYRSGYASVRDGGMAHSYRDWVAEVVARYRDDPTILAWQLLNEAEVLTPGGRCSPSASRTLKHFAQDMAGLVKGIDPNHLLSLGSWGLLDCGTAGFAYQDVHSVAGLDFCEIHDYSGPESVLTAVLKLRLNQCRALGKPLFVGEMGVRLQDAGSLTNRAAAIRAKLSAQFAAGVAGALVWDWANADQVPYSGYEVQPGDPTLQALAAFS